MKNVLIQIVIDGTGRLVEYIFQIPYQANRLVKWCGFLFVVKAGFPQLTQECFDTTQIVHLDGFREFINDSQNTPWIKLCGVCRKNNSNPKTIQVINQGILFLFGCRFFLSVTNGSPPMHIIDIGISSVFNSIKKNYLTFNVLNELKKQVILPLLWQFGEVFIKKRSHDIFRGFVFRIGILTNIGKERQVKPRFFNAFKRKSQK